MKGVKTVGCGTKKGIVMDTLLRDRKALSSYVSSGNCAGWMNSHTTRPFSRTTYCPIYTFKNRVYLADRALASRGVCASWF